MTALTNQELQRRAALGIPLSDLQIVDAHGHLGRWCTVPLPAATAREMLSTLDLAGVSRLAISANAAIGPDFRRGNDQVAAALRAFPDRYLAYAVVNPNYPDEVRPELERCFDQLGFHAIKLHTGLHNYPLNGEHYVPVFEFAQERRATILTHGCAGLAEVAAKYPDVSIIIAHLGAGFDGRQPNSVLELARDLPNIHFDTASSNVPFKNVNHLVQAVGPNQVVFGSDHPWIDVRYQLGRIIWADLDLNDKLKILGRNFEGLLARTRH